jgi:hypothetical protein
MAKQPKDMDFIAQAQESGKHFSDTAKYVKVTPTPDSRLSKSDGHLGDRADSKGPRLWADINPAAKPNTDTGPGGSKRRSEKY